MDKRAFACHGLSNFAFARSHLSAVLPGCAVGVRDHECLCQSAPHCRSRGDVPLMHLGAKQRRDMTSASAQIPLRRSPVQMFAQSDKDGPLDIGTLLLLSIFGIFVIFGVVTLGASAFVVLSAYFSDKSWTDIGLNILTAICLFAIFRAAVAFIVADQPCVPPLDGSSAVGSRILQHPSTGGRVRVFYPAEEGGQPAPYFTDGVESSNSLASLVGFYQLGLGFLLEHLGMATSGCIADARPLGQQRWPLLVFSHGYGGTMDMSCYFFRQLASQGVVVLAVEHTDGTASRAVQNGTPVAFNPFKLSPADQQSRRALEILSAGTSLPNDLRGIVDEDRFFLSGHSYGGPSAVTAGLIADSRGRPVRGVILMDPAIGLVGVNSLPNVPVMTFLSEEYDSNNVRAGVNFMCRGAFHGNFVDAPLWAPSWVMRLVSLAIPAAGPAEPVKLHLALAKACAVFMKHSGPDDPWDSVLAAGPAVFVRRSGRSLSGGSSLR